MYTSYVCISGNVSSLHAEFLETSYIVLKMFTFTDCLEMFIKTTLCYDKASLCAGVPSVFSPNCLYHSVITSGTQKLLLGSTGVHLLFEGDLKCCFAERWISFPQQHLNFIHRHPYASSQPSFCCNVNCNTLKKLQWKNGNPANCNLHAANKLPGFCNCILFVMVIPWSEVAPRHALLSPK